MCGIFGCIGNIEHKKVWECINAIKHRGPDYVAIKELPGISLAHARLSILDLSDNANQPMSDRTGRYWIVYNGEVYNYLELKKELELKGYQFQTNSDTEVVLYSYIEWGEKFQNKCNGMWSIVIWDSLKKEVFLSRDRFGIKPFYYYSQDNNFYFGSEMKSFFPIMKQKRINYSIFEKKDYFSYEATEYCSLKDIKKIKAGYCGYFRNGELQLHRWWNTLDNLMIVPTNYSEQVEYFRELFLDACKLRMRSDVPIGTALSGGVDSSTVIGVMHYLFQKNERTINHDWQHAYVASMPGTLLDETKYAQKAADYVGVKLNKVVISPKITPDKIFEYIRICEEPYITSPIPFMQTYGNISEDGTKVTIDGHGADELFGGYIPDLLYACNEDNLSENECRELWNIYNNVALKEQKISYDQFLIQSKGVEKRTLNEQLYLQTHTKTLPTLLRCYDRYSMGNSLEIRMPFMDYRIVSFAFSIPWQAKLGNGYTKRIVRDMAAPFMDRNIIYRKNKIGFNSPITEWMHGEWKEFILDEISSSEFYNCELINPLDIIIEIQEFYNGNKNEYRDGELIWTKLAPYFWKKALKI